MEKPKLKREPKIHQLSIVPTLSRYENVLHELEDSKQISHQLLGVQCIKLYELLHQDYESLQHNQLLVKKLRQTADQMHRILSDIRELKSQLDKFAFELVQTNFDRMSSFRQMVFELNNYFLETVKLCEGVLSQEPVWATVDLLHQEKKLTEADKIKMLVSFDFQGIFEVNSAFFEQALSDVKKCIGELEHIDLEKEEQARQRVELLMFSGLVRLLRDGSEQGVFVGTWEFALGVYLNAVKIGESVWKELEGEWSYLSEVNERLIQESVLNIQSLDIMANLKQKLQNIIRGYDVQIMRKQLKALIEESKSRRYIGQTDEQFFSELKNFRKEAKQFSGKLELWEELVAIQDQFY